LRPPVPPPAWRQTHKKRRGKAVERAERAKQIYNQPDCDNLIRKYELEDGPDPKGEKSGRPEKRRLESRDVAKKKPPRKAQSKDNEEHQRVGRGGQGGKRSPSHAAVHTQRSPPMTESQRFFENEHHERPNPAGRRGWKGGKMTKDGMEDYLVRRKVRRHLRSRPFKQAVARNGAGLQKIRPKRGKRKEDRFEEIETGKRTGKDSRKEKS